MNEKTRTEIILSKKCQEKLIIKTKKEMEEKLASPPRLATKPYLKDTYLDPLGWLAPSFIFPHYLCKLFDIKNYLLFFLSINRSVFLYFKFYKSSHLFLYFFFQLSSSVIFFSAFDFPTVYIFEIIIVKGFWKSWENVFPCI